MTETAKSLPDRCECEGWIGRWAYHDRNDQPETFRCSDCDRILADTSAADRRPADQGDTLGLIEHIDAIKRDPEAAARRMIELEAEVDRLLSEVADLHAVYGVGGPKHQLPGAVDRLREVYRLILDADVGDWDRTIPTLAQYAEAGLRELGGQS